MPGYKTRTVGTGRIILHAVEDPQNLYLPGGVIIDASAADYRGTKVLPAGVPLVRDAGTGLYVPFKATLANGAGTTSTTLIVDDASLFLVGDPIYVGATATTVSAINYTTNTITLAAAATWTDNSTVAPSNGYRAATDVAGILSDEFGVDLQPDGVDEDVPARMLIRGRVKADAIIGGDVLFASIAAGEQPHMSGIQFWRGDERVA